MSKVILISGWRGSGKSTTARLICDTIKSFLALSGRTIEVKHFADAIRQKCHDEYGLTYDQMNLPDLKEEALPSFPVRITSGDTWCVALFNECHSDLKPLKGIAPIKTNGGPCSNDGLDTFLFKPHEKENKDYYKLIKDDHICLKKGNFYFPLYHSPRSLMIIVGGTERLVDVDVWAKKVFGGFKEYEARTKSGNNFLVIGDWRYPSERRCAYDMFGKENVVTIRIQRFYQHPTNSDACSERALDNASFDYILDNMLTLDYFATDTVQRLLQTLKSKKFF